jgi:hypothetical protein
MAEIGAGGDMHRLVSSPACASKCSPTLAVFGLALLLSTTIRKCGRRFCDEIMLDLGLLRQFATARNFN